MSNLPNAPGEGITWKPGTYVYVKVPRRKGLLLAELTKTGRRWAEVKTLTPPLIQFKRFDMNNGLEDSPWASTLWASPNAFERSDQA